MMMKGKAVLFWMGLAVSTAWGQGPVADLPFKFDYSGGVPVLSMTLNHRASYSFLLDSGSGLNVVDPAAFREVGGTISSTMGLGSLAGRVTYSGTGALTFSSGGGTWVDPGVLVQPVPAELRQMFGVETGWMGQPWMRQGIVEIDYESRRVRVWDREKFQPPTDALALEQAKEEGRPNRRRPARGSDPRPMIRARLNGIEATFLLDTGSNGMVSIGSVLAKRLGLDSRQPYCTGGVVGTDGVPVTKSFYAGMTLGVGDFELGPLVVGVTPSRGADEHLLVGWGALHGFRWWFDLAGGRIWVKKRNAFDPTKSPLAWLYEGVHHAERGEWEPAAAAWRRTLEGNFQDRIQRKKLIEALYQLGRPEDARQEEEAFRRLRGTDLPGER